MDPRKAWHCSSPTLVKAAKEVLPPNWAVWLRCLAVAAVWLLPSVQRQWVGRQSLQLFPCSAALKIWLLCAQYPASLVQWFHFSHLNCCCFCLNCLLCMCLLSVSSIRLSLHQLYHISMWILTLTLDMVQMKILHWCGSSWPILLPWGRRLTTLRGEMEQWRSATRLSGGVSSRRSTPSSRSRWGLKSSITLSFSSWSLLDSSLSSIKATKSSEFWLWPSRDQDSNPQILLPWWRPDCVLGDVGCLLLHKHFHHHRHGLR